MLDKDIEKVEDLDFTIATKIKFILDYIHDEVEKNGDMSQFKEDVMYVIHMLLEKQLHPAQLTACEIRMKQQGYIIQKAKEEHLERYISKLKTEIDTHKQLIDGLETKLMFALSPTNSELSLNTQSNFKRIIRENLESDTYTIRKELKKYWNDTLNYWSRKEVENEQFRFK